MSFSGTSLRAQGVGTSVEDELLRVYDTSVSCHIHWLSAVPGMICSCSSTGLTPRSANVHRAWSQFSPVSTAAKKTDEVIYSVMLKANGIHDCGYRPLKILEAR